MASMAFENSLGNEIRKQIASRIILGTEKNMDLLQGLLAHMAWILAFTEVQRITSIVFVWTQDASESVCLYWFHFKISKLRKIFLVLPYQHAMAQPRYYENVSPDLPVNPHVTPLPSPILIVVEVMLYPGSLG
ncbi:hypothetical protein V1527DRAFT_486292 [Lipomyces starkeyi]